MHKLITWDWKDQPPLAEILDAAQNMVDSHLVFQYVLPDTGGDYYACIISTYVLSPLEAERILAGEEPVSGEWDSPGTSPEEDDDG